MFEKGKIKGVVDDISKNLKGIDKVILFGSAARSEKYEDIDLLVVYKNAPDLNLLNEICNKMVKEKRYNFRIQHILDYDTLSLMPSEKNDSREIHLLHSNKKELIISQHPIVNNIANDGIVLYSN